MHKTLAPQLGCMYRLSQSSSVANIFQMLCTTVVISIAPISRFNTPYKYILQAFLSLKHIYQDRIYVVSLPHTTSDIPSQEMHLRMVWVSTLAMHRGKPMLYPPQIRIHLYAMYEWSYPSRTRVPLMTAHTQPSQKNFGTTSQNGGPEQSLLQPQTLSPSHHHHHQVEEYMVVIFLLTSSLARLQLTEQPSESILLLLCVCPKLQHLYDAA